MSEKSLKKAARLRIPQQMPDVETKVIMMLMADRADDSGRFEAMDDELMEALELEVPAVMARLAGDPFVRAGVDNARVTRVVDAYLEAKDDR